MLPQPRKEDGLQDKSRPADDSAKMEPVSITKAKKGLQAAANAAARKALFQKSVPNLCKPRPLQGYSSFAS
ncbi:hypothetical protein J2TS6_58800 [Paenibacillus albilobatus]|uniref:Uncharacterized protein n=1 Tax=Paenibacillus albilobatus TaxID=2716884 RepID=A0A919XMZ8_9BACL|nr:hypothetical protein J2TS6_58800 [Paenibacillus albilobatus]